MYDNTPDLGETTEPGQPDTKSIPKVTSQARTEANRANATKSTGPRTQAGKDRSRRNALRHGAYALDAQPLAADAFDEDEGEIPTFLSSIIDSLDPRDELEHTCAFAVAKCALSMRRMDNYETSLLSAAGHLSADEEQLLGGSEQALQRDQMILARMSAWNDEHGSSRGAVATTDGPDLGDPQVYPFQLMTRYLRRTPARKRVIPAPQEKPSTPNTPESWKAAFVRTVDQRWPESAAFARWVYQHQLVVLEDLRLIRLRDSRLSANRAVTTMERTSTAKARLSRDFDRAFAQYQMLRGRPDRTEV